MILINYIRSIGVPIMLLLFIFLLDPYSLAIKAGYLMVMALLLFKGKEYFYNIDKDFMILLTWSVTYTMFNYFVENKGIQYLIIQATFPVFFYALGKMMVTKQLSNKSVFFLLITIGFVYSISAILSIALNLVQAGFAQTNRVIPSFWNGTEIKATGMAGFLIYNSLIPAIVVSYRKKLGHFMKITLLSIYGVTLICGFRLGSRTLLVVAGVSFLLSLLYVLYKQSIKDNIRLVFSLTLIVMIIYLYVPFDLDSPIFSTLGNRLQNPGAAENTATAGNRTGLWAEGLENLFKHPLGWKASQHHHNLWLDTPKVAGFVPLIFLLIHNFSLFLNLKKIFSFSNTDIGLNTTFLLYFVATYLLFFTEPVIEGNFFSFVVYCLLFGVLKGFIRLKENKNLASPT